MRIVYWTRLPLGTKQITEALKASPGCELTVADSLPALLEALPGADGVVLYDAPPPDAKQVIDALNAEGNTVRWMHFVTAGREGFEAVGLPRHVAITYAAGAASPAVAEHAMTLALAVGRRLHETFAQKEAHAWNRAPAQRATSLEGQTMAIVGYGQIGQEIAKRARGFGVRIVAVSRSARADALVDEARPLTDLHAVLGESDVVVIAIALTPETRHLFDAAAFAACRKGAIVVNIARGGVVDQAALRAALESGQIGGAGLDVADPEPLPATDPLWDAPNLIVTPHYAGAGSPATLRRLAEGVRENLRRLQAGEALLYRVE